MATVRLNDSGVNRAKALIEAGQVDMTSGWTFTEADQTVVLGEASDWAEYSGVHLGIRTGEDRDTKNAYAYPFAKAGKVFRSGLVDARQRAAQQGHIAVFNEAGRLLELLEPKEGDTIEQMLAAVGAKRCAVEITPMDELPVFYIQLFPLTDESGIEVKDGRHFVFTEDGLRNVIAEFNSIKKPLVLDFDHNTYNSNIPMASLAAGWIEELWPVFSDTDFEQLAEERLKDVIRRHEGEAGLYAKVRLTDDAAELVADQKYKYISPVFREDSDGVVEMLLNAALTNDPALTDMIPIAARRKPIIANPDDDDDTRNANPESKPSAKGSTMDWKILAAALKVEANTEEEFKAALMARENERVSVEARALRAENEAKALREATEKASLEAKVDKAIEEKFILSDQREFWLGQSEEMLTAFLATAKPYTTEESKELPPQGKMIDREEDGSKAESTGLIKLHVGEKVLGVKPRPIKTDEAEQRLAELKARHGGDMAKALRNQSRRVVGG